MCVIQHRNWPLRSTILNAHGTNASPDGLCTRTHTNEAVSCWFCCNSFRVDRARRRNVCLKWGKAEGAKRPKPFFRHAWAVLKKAWIVVYIWTLHMGPERGRSTMDRGYELEPGSPGAVDCTVRNERHRTRLACRRPGARAHRDIAWGKVPSTARV